MYLVFFLIFTNIVQLLLLSVVVFSAASSVSSVVIVNVERYSYTSTDFLFISTNLAEVNISLPPPGLQFNKTRHDSDAKDNQVSLANGVYVGYLDFIVNARKIDDCQNIEFDFCLCANQKEKSVISVNLNFHLHDLI